MIPFQTVWIPGSSPLARGLPVISRKNMAAYGIIPARAGFTASRVLSTTWGWDHPRSRGVYVAPKSVPVGNRGSSPLARGLPELTGRSVGDRRIIPARAGFTIIDHSNPSAAWDHPRSRGVYSITVLMPSQTDGSSPLARGLRRLIGGRPQRKRIIPARAGFTVQRRGPSCCGWDHPRSRGVYSRLHPR